MDRRLLILMWLREEAAVRATDLAAECGCSVRTVYRDLDALSQSGVPVAAMPGEGYRLVPGYHLPPVAFTADEAVQLLLGADIALGLGTAPQREPSPWLPLLQQAVLQQRVLCLRYHSYSPDEITERRVEAHGLVYYGNDWHMVGLLPAARGDARLPRQPYSRGRAS
jgi:predicted DNA-binding transcriptional regulator YafY